MLFCPNLECWHFSSREWELKNNDEIYSLKAKLEHWDFLLLSVFAEWTDGHWLHCEKKLISSFKVLKASFRQSQKRTMDYPSFKRLIHTWVLNMKAMYPARVKARKKDFSVLAGKQQKCRGRALLICHSKNFPIQLAWHTISLRN